MTVDGGLRPGVNATLERVVEDRHCTVRGDQAILSTPNLVMLLEEASMAALEPYLMPGQSSVGVRVEVRHLAATPKGMRVRARATVREIDRRRVTFDVVIDDEVERVGEASHDRFLIDLDRFTERLKQKKVPRPA
jgi:predicted thioesterase